MPGAVQTFDVFDTLIARRGVEPRSVLDKLEARAGIPGLAQVRVDADRRLGAAGQAYELRDIWQEVGRVMGLDTSVADRFMKLEIEIEHEEVIPVTENLALVRDGDVLVSDTYLPVEVVRSLLRRAGLDKQVALTVSNDGKHRGQVWVELLDKVRIDQHFGDNLHSDGRTPSEAGIRAVIYTGARRTQVEQFLAGHGWSPLADLAREVRLANPFFGDRLQERHLWNLTCQLNFPLLYLASLHLERLARERNVSEVLFVSRDCLLWHELYRELFPHRRSTYLYASRKCLLQPSASYLEYFRSTWHPDSLIVDLFSTGASWSKLFERLGVRGRCFFIGLVDDYAYLPDAPPPQERLDVAVIFRNSEFETPLNKGMEMLNYASHPSVEDIALLPGGAALPVLAQTFEYDPGLPEAAHRSLRTGVQALAHYPDLPRVVTQDVGEIIKTLVRLVCADPHLPVIYSGHQAADEAYLRSILA